MAKNPIRISYFGIEGSFAHEVAQKAYPHARDFLAGVTAEGVLENLYQDKADCGIIPIENTTGGMIANSIDALISTRFIRSKNRIQEELVFPINLKLMANVSLQKIRTVFSHPVPLNFMNHWLKRHLPYAKCVPTESTSEGAMLAARDPYGAAIANKASAEIYGLNILRVRLPQQPNQTIFCAIAQKSITRETPKRTAICFGLPNHPGSLLKILTILGNQKINLTRIVSRPLLKRNGQFRPHEYVFWVDFEGNPKNQHIRNALDQARCAASFLDIVGEYSRRKV